MSAYAARLAEFPVFGHVSQATYYRLLIPEILTEPKVIYVDADIVVPGNLAELWEIPMGDNLLLGVQQGSVTQPVRIAGIDDYKIPGDHPRLSAGVLVMNLQKWRTENPFEELKRYFIKYHDDIRFWDQDALNVVLAHRWSRIPGDWNYLVDCSHEIDGDPQRVRANLKQDAKIIHYASATKPWHYYGDHPAKTIFYEYLDGTVWAGWRPSPPLVVLRNPHVWGEWLRRLPLVGRLWAWMRARNLKKNGQ
jgi:lipopolysaccharide biosynthesis glycosyltransferase